MVLNLLNKWNAAESGKFTTVSCKFSKLARRVWKNLAQKTVVNNH